MKQEKRKEDKKAKNMKKVGIKKIGIGFRKEDMAYNGVGS
jgi:hypothetical protein